MNRALPPAIRLSPAAASRLAFVGAAAGLGLLAGRNGPFALAAAAALAFVALVWVDYPFAVGVFIITTFLAVPGVAAKGIGAVLVLAWFAQLTLRSGRDYVDFAEAHKGIAALLVAFLTWTLLSVAWAESTSSVLGSLGRYIPNFVVFFVVYAAVNQRRHGMLLLGFFVAGAAIAAADAVVSPAPAAAYSDLSRTGGTFGDPNYLAAVLVVGLALGAAVGAMRSRPPLTRVSAVIAALLCLAGILLSVSRGGLIALGVALVASVFVARGRRAALAGATILVTVLSVGYFAVYAAPGARQHLTDTNGGSGRTDVWAVGWRMVQAHPLNGVGAGNFPISGRHYLLRPGLTTHAQFILSQFKVAHNTYLELLAEGGIPALALFLAIVGASLRAVQLAWRAFRRSEDHEMELVSYALFAGLLGLLAASFFLSEEYSKQLWVLLAFGPVMLRVSSLPHSNGGQQLAAVG